MLVAVDVCYTHVTAHAAAVVFADWYASEPFAQYTLRVPVAQGYVPGRFYRRELGPLAAVLEQVRQPLECVIVDGYATFGPDRPALGQYLFDRLGGKVAVVGVAKRKFHPAQGDIAVVRGSSRRPLYITSIGIPVETAAQAVARMHGRNRIPTLLKLADRLSRSLE
jgi:deoxyribonuclease V